MTISPSGRAIRPVLSVVFAIFAAAAAFPALSATVTFVPQGAVWKYLDNGTNQGTVWQAPAFDDSAWAAGPAELGYGDNNEATVVSFGPNSSNKYITTYFRYQFNVADKTGLVDFTLRMLRDDGAVVYLNGAEILRSNMPTGTITHTTLAASNSEATVTATIPAASVNVGVNTFAVEIHQVNATSSDISFYLEFLGNNNLPNITRGPYLQMGSSSAVTVRWRTSSATESTVNYGLSPGALTSTVTNAPLTTEHIVALTNLQPNTQYFYSISTTGGVLTGGDANHFFFTAPPTGPPHPTRVWVLGDSGTADANAAAVRNAYAAFTGATYTNLILMLGDNAYDNGTDAEFQAAVFNMYPAQLRQSVLWPTLGNHDAVNADSPTESGVYYNIFSLPRAGEAGGLASGTEAYYSFDYGNIHFICLDSHDTPRGDTSAMMTWLENDIASTT